MLRTYLSICTTLYHSHYDIFCCHEGQLLANVSGYDLFKHIKLVTRIQLVEAYQYYQSSEGASYNEAAVLIKG
jgi:hypothetical protein